MKELLYVLPQAAHDALVEAAYVKRGYNTSEAAYAVKSCASAAQHGIRTHNAIKALHLDTLFGSLTGGCVPDADIGKKSTCFPSTVVWNANKKLGQATAYEAMETAIQLADSYGVGTVVVDNAFHYLWGGGYVLEAACQGYIAYTNCTATLAEVVPFGGKYPTLGTNPHSWAFPTEDVIGFNIVVDWATSVIAMGRVQQFLREGKSLPENVAIDKHGQVTTQPSDVAALLPFGAHKGYGLSLINELFAAYIGGSIPTLRGQWLEGSPEKHTTNFVFQVIHPESISAGDFAHQRTQVENVKVVIEDLLGHGNDQCLLPGQMEAEFMKKTIINEGLLFTANEIRALNEIAVECGCVPWILEDLKEAL